MATTSHIPVKSNSEIAQCHKNVPIFLICSLEVGSCIAVQVCMIQIPLLILFNAFYVSSPLLLCFQNAKLEIVTWSEPFFLVQGCWIRTCVQWHPPLGQHFQCHSGQLHFHGWEMWLFSGWVEPQSFLDKTVYRVWCSMQTIMKCFVHRDSSSCGLPHPFGPLLLRSFSTLLLIYFPGKSLRPWKLNASFKRTLVLHLQRVAKK